MIGIALVGLRFIYQSFRDRSLAFDRKGTR